MSLTDVLATPGATRAIATAGAMGETVGFYGTSFAQRMREIRGDAEHPHRLGEAMVESVRYLLATYAIAEVIDTPVGSAAMCAVPTALAGVGIGGGVAVDFVGGKLIADHVYFGIGVPCLTRIDCVLDCEEPRSGKGVAPMTPNHADTRCSLFGALSLPADKTCRSAFTKIAP